MLHAVERGEGPQTVYLVHGFLGMSRNLLSLARRLAEGQPNWRIVLPDLRGHGASPPLRSTDGLTDLADDLAELAAARGGGQATLIGHSLGGRVALLALARHPEIFAHASLLDITPGRLPGLTGPMQRVFERLMGAPPHAPNRADLRNFFLAGGIDSGLTDWVMTNLDVAPDGSVSWRIDRAALARLHWAEGDDDLWPQAEQCGPQLFALCGGQSGFVPPGDRDRFRAVGAAVRVLPAAGHFLHVDALTETVQSLLAETPAATGDARS